MSDVLFTPFNIGKLRIPNRIVHSAVSERGASNGIINEELTDYYRKLAEGGAGLVVTGYAYVHKSGRCNLRQTGIDNDAKIPSLKKLTDAFHKAAPKAKIAIQLVHGGRQSKPYAVSRLIAPSPVPLGDAVPATMDEAMIEEIIDAFAKGAERAVKAGFDAVQLHGAHGFLINQFLSSHTNLRDDKWGGSPEKRRRFFIEVINRVRKRIGYDFPLFAKINGCDFLDDVGITFDEAAETALEVEGAGLDALEVSGGTADTDPKLGAVRKGINSRKKEAYFLTQAKIIRKSVTIPVITVGGIRSAQVARKIINEKSADAVALARPLIREPDLPNKWKEGKTHSRCVSCNGCLIDTGEITHCVLESVDTESLNFLKDPTGN